jgi:putative peptidoglycan lipid II flippase
LETPDPPNGGGTPSQSDGRNASLVAAGILLSRVAGLVREIVTAGVLGVGVSADAFKAALRIPNLLQNLLGEGVLSASFIPVYSRLIDGDDDEEAGAMAGAVAGLLAAITSVLVIVGYILARPITLLLTPGFSDDPDKLDLTVDLVRIMFPGIGILVLSAWCLGVLNSHRRFFLSYVAPVLWNVGQIIGVTAVAIGGSTDRTLAEGLAWGVVFGGAAQFAVQVPTVVRLVPKLRLSLDRKRPTVHDALSRVGAVVFGRGVVQLSGYIDLFLASLLATGAVAADGFAQVIYLMPVSVFGMSVAAAELPELSRLNREARHELIERLDRGLVRIAYFVVPTAVLYITTGETIVGALLQRGEFGRSDTRLVWLILAAYSLGLLATTASRLLQNTLYALDDPKTPARVAFARVVVGTVVALLLMFPFDSLVLAGTNIERGSAAGLLHLGGVGIALGSATSAWVEFFLLRTALAWRIGRVELAGGALAPIVVSALAAAATARVLFLVIGDPPPMLAAIIGLVPAMGVYFGLSFRLGLPSVRTLISQR